MKNKPHRTLLQVKPLSAPPKSDMVIELNEACF